MASTIVTRYSENALSLSASGLARKVTFPANWSKVRVGARLIMVSTGGNIIGSPKFWMGIAKGTTGLVGTAQCEHFCGVVNTSASMTYGVYTYQLTLAATKKVGSTSTTSATITFPYFGNTQTAAQRTLIFIDISKGSPNYTVGFFARTVSSAVNTTRAIFDSQMVLPVPVQNADYSTAATPKTVAVDESTDGVFDSIQLYWDKATNNVEIVDLAFAVLA